MPLPLGLLAGAAVAGILGVAGRHYIVRISKARAWLSKGGVLVDVDSAGEFAREHPDVAVSIPLEDLARRAHELGGKERRVVVYAHSWRRGARAVYELRGIGFGEVMNAAGADNRDRLAAELSRVAQAREAKSRPDEKGAAAADGGESG